MNKIFFTTIIYFLIAQCQSQNWLIVEFEPEQDLFGTDYHITKNDSLIYTNCTIKNDIQKLYDLSDGVYKIKFNTIFGIDSLKVNVRTGHENLVTLKTESIDTEKLVKTKSEIESLLEGERISVNYELGSCFKSENYKLILTKRNGKYYRLLKNKLRSISNKKVKNLIRFEKTLRNLKIEQNLDNTTHVVTCSEFFTFEKNGKVTFSKNVFCGDWSKSSEITKWMK
jgi:hypothetical protein